jgi:hypothetical protein
MIIPTGIPVSSLGRIPQPPTHTDHPLLHMSWTFPLVWKHTRVFSTLKLGKDPALPSTYRPISLLDTIGKLFEKILIDRIPHEISERRLMRDEQFGFRPRHSTPRRKNNQELRRKRLTGAVFLDVA